MARVSEEAGRGGRGEIEHARPGGQHGDELAAERLMPSLTGTAHRRLSAASPGEYLRYPPRDSTSDWQVRRRAKTMHALRSCDRPNSARRRFTLAREKNTSRSEARRRSRELTRAQLAPELDPEESTDEVPAANASPVERKPLFRIPNVGADINALPSILTSRRMLLVPLALLIVGFILLLVYPGLSPDIQGLAGYYLQFFFVPPALFTFFLAGFFAPRASYLVGALYGLIAGVMWATLASGLIIAGAPTTPEQPVTPQDPVTTSVVYLFTGLIYGTVAAALAAWYRDFLRGVQERGRERRALREVDERTRRREERQEARKLAKQRPT